uniref:Uncharacterized protein n=1 Tax=Tanacetum cinerariifolium TaxID=118510 RepID=A0A6L2NWG4_TANCI|nr:hypothetical protein [Tanacetum cinerariifolium]
MQPAKQRNFECSDWDFVEDDTLVVVEQQVRQSSALDSALQVPQTFSILVVVEVSGLKPMWYRNRPIKETNRTLGLPYFPGSENCPPMLNKENYISWSSHLLQYAKNRPNGKIIHNSIINGPYVRRMIPEPGGPNRKVPVNETFHVQTDDELTKKELK